METLLTAEDIATKAQMTVPAVYRYAREGKIPSIKIGTKVRFPQASIQQ
jgi:excisionase family DNA binding protein